MKKLPITHLQPMLVAVASLATFAGGILEDGAVNFKDIPALLTTLPKFAGFVQLQPILAAQESIDLDADEKASLVNAFKTELNLPVEAQEALVEALVEGSLIVLVGLSKIVAVAKSFKPV